MRRRVTLICLAAALAASTIALGQLPGTLYGDIRDENEEPIPGVKITVVDPESPDNALEFESDKRGRYTVFVPNSLPTYTITLSKEGFQEKTLAGIKIPARQRRRGNFTMTSQAAAIEAMRAANPELDQPVEAGSGGFAELYNEGVEALNVGDLATAKARFQESLEKKPDYGPAHGGLAKVLWKQEDWEGAKLHGEKSLELNPDDKTVHQVLYAAYSGLGENAKANEILKEMQAENPEKAGKNMFNTAADLYNSGDIAQAKEMFIKILEVDPTQAKAHYLLGMCYVNEGANAQAREHLQKFIDLAPNDPDAALAQEMMGYLE
ncbi:MAG: tetratricopeptide repeat protein [Thermoanaerobaculia bacterium]|nr:tetratricopeptide repeat protein [Thermoanaerobaculia bacterium]